ELRPQHLAAKLQMLHDLTGISGGCGHDEMLLAEPRRGAVVHGEAVLAQHQSVAGAADFQRREFVDVDAVEQRRGVRPLNVDLAERRHIANPDGPPHRRGLPRDALLQGLAWALIPLRPEPQPGIGEYRAVFLGPGMRRRQAFRAEILAAMMPCERTP